MKQPSLFEDDARVVASGDPHLLLSPTGERRVSRYDPVTLARATDPDTSYEAAEKILEPRGEIQENIHALFVEHGPMHDDRLILRYRAAHGHIRESTVRTRRHELVVAGVLEDSLEVEVLASGRSSIIWRLR